MNQQNNHGRLVNTDVHEAPTQHAAPVRMPYRAPKDDMDGPLRASGVMAAVRRIGIAALVLVGLLAVSFTAGVLRAAGIF